MSLILKTGSGLFAGIVAGGLGFAFWPHVEPSLVAMRPAVEKPVFVTAAAPAQPTATTPAPSPIVTQAQPVPDPTAVSKLAAALASTPAPSPAATKPVVVAKANDPAKAADAAKTSAPSEATSKLCAEGLVALASGDISGARAFLEPAAEAGDGRALMVLGDTYDPSTLTRMGAVGLRGDAARARDYYARALALGFVAARQRLAALDTQGN